ncbi:MAG: tRNA (adenosine(37)-N6)-threonylcarbamoyltransferase complex ATPase subunit type 1 TsaE [Gemmatimonadota bacterium]|nr:tRNA (adenosine(37)-N6)-threonylcarbamoyltransferase complex ATPase subunit type 1 TsaE [Gemmatimonadota bacterium]
MLEPHHHVVPSLAPGGHLTVTQAELESWGERFGRAVSPPLVVAISGELGAGKTTLVKAICHGCGVVEPVTSPTFALVHEYQGRHFPIYHLDLYRLASPAELTNVGWDEIVSSHALVLIEWPERAGGRLPPDALGIELESVAGAPERRVLLAG